PAVGDPDPAGLFEAAVSDVSPAFAGVLPPPCAATACEGAVGDVGGVVVVVAAAEAGEPAA
ncbi:MAG TPA: hypothetical protein VMD28_03715, partial [Acidimicrobiales bacterium]|nr:hypothetical protein [Acidimicrobiales bacterium]